MYGFLTAFDRYGNIVAECDASAFDGDMLADTDHVLTDDGVVIGWEELARLV